MGSGKLLAAVGLLSVLSMLLVPTLGQAFAADRPDEQIVFSPRLPSVGSVYAVNISSSAHVSTTGDAKPMEVYLELNVTGVKDWGVPTITLAIVSGFVKLGDNTYELDHGKTSIVPVWRLKAKEYSEDGVNVLTMEASLTRQIPLSTTDPPVALVPGVDEKTIEFRTLTENWIVNYFAGSISRIK
jgi:hypothetical protein